LISRRAFCACALCTSWSDAATPAVQGIPVRLIWDRRATSSSDKRRRFLDDVWREAVRDFERAGVQLRPAQAVGEIRQSPGGQPVLIGLEHGVVNMVLTDRVPLAWDGGRALHGLSTCGGGYHLSVIALKYAHPHQIPMLSVNTCVHELLHLILQDVYERRPKGIRRETRELRIDWYATRLWLFYQYGDLRDQVCTYLGRLASVPESLSAPQTRRRKT
jgi:hypothetical protein